jgi:hypothetical protein
MLVYLIAAGKVKIEMSSQEVTETKRMLVDIEDLKKDTPIDIFLKESSDLKDIMSSLDKAYDKREKVIDRILTEGTGFESRKALRMFPTSLLEKWADELK